MDGGRFHTVHSSTTKAVCAASNKRPTTSQGRGRPGPRHRRTRIGLALAAGPERWTAMEGGCPIIVDGECIGGIGVSGGDWETDERIAREAVESIGASWNHVTRSSIMAIEPLRVACIGMGWWSDVLADAIKRSGKIEIVACYTRSADKRDAFAAKYGCRPAASYEEMLADHVDRGDHQHHAEQRASRDHARGGRGRQARVPRQADRQHRLRRPRDHARRAARPASCWRSAISAAARATSAGSSSRSTPARSASWSTPRPTSAATGSARSISRRGAIPGRRHAGRRDAADRHPLHRRAGIPDGAGRRRCSGQLRAAGAARRQSGRREPDPRARERRALHAERELRLGVRVLPDEHLRQGSHRLLRPAQRPAPAQARRATSRRRSPCAKNDTFVEELEEFAAACAAAAQPEMDGERATALARGGARRHPSRRARAAASRSRRFCRND